MTAARNLLFLSLALAVPNCAFSQFVYRVNAGKGISAYALDPVSRELKEVSGSPFAAGANPSSVAVDPAAKFVYVANAGSGDISVYAIDASNGALRAISGERFQAGLMPSGVTVDPTGRFLYVSDSASGIVSAYRIDRESGALTAVPGSPFTAGNSNESVVVDSTGTFAYVTGAGGIWAFRIDAESGGLSPVSGSPFGAAELRSALALDRHNLSSSRMAVTQDPSTPPGMPLVTAFTPGAPRNNFTAGYGMQFTVGSAPLFVTALGRIYISGNAGMHVVKLVRVSDGADVPGGSVTVSLPNGGTPGQFVYTPLASPVTLDANASYYLISQETSGGDLFYDASPVTADGIVSVNSAVVYWPGVGFLPVGRPNHSFGPVNLLYSMTAVTPPGVSITAPAAGATISGNNVTVTATAGAAAGLTIASVQFQVDSANVGAPVTTAPYTIALDTTKLTNGPHVLTAVATDSANTPGTSAPVNVTVNNTVTTVTITAPAAGSVSGSVPVSAAAIPGTGLTITSVQFKLDNANFGAPLTASPYSIVLDTTKLPNGPHTLAAVATDSANNAVTSAPPVAITVNNTATTVAVTAPVT
ncbi:MAG: Ig-like domain-containing protein, partial [Acidobacteriota bacterium]|nr:Ig-like domain-containing protein [Acidobacteriota bacterium]